VMPQSVIMSEAARIYDFRKCTLRSRSQPAASRDRGTIANRPHMPIRRQPIQLGENRSSILKIPQALCQSSLQLSLIYLLTCPPSFPLPPLHHPFSALTAYPFRLTPYPSLRILRSNVDPTTSASRLQFRNQRSPRTRERTSPLRRPQRI